MMSLEKTINEFMVDNAGTPASEFSPKFVENMVRAMMVSYHKYGLVHNAYPEQFDAVADIRLRLSKYRETGNFWYLVDVANFAMIEAMHPRHEKAHWGENTQAESPGRVSNEDRRPKQVDNQGGRIGGDTFLHIPHDYKD